MLGLVGDWLGISTVLVWFGLDCLVVRMMMMGILGKGIMVGREK